MSSIKIFTNWTFLFCLISGQAPDQQLESFGLFDFRSTNINNDVKTVDFFADSNIMYDTLYETVLNTNSGTANDNISNETKIQKIKTYNRFLKQLSLLRKLNTDDLLPMTKVQGQKRRNNIQLNNKLLSIILSKRILVSGISLPNSFTKSNFSK